ncbi:MAG: Xaa-Pro peptidase family protein, partial [Chloroflexota bacterium]
MLKPMLRRLEKLRSNLADKGFDAILVSHQENRRYLSGFTGSSGYLVVSAKHALLATDFRYFEQVKLEAPHFELVPLKGYGARWLPETLSDIGAKRVAFEAAYLPFSSYRQFVDAMTHASTDLQFIPEEGMVESLRAVKEAEELAFISAAARLTHTALKRLTATVHPGVTERELAWELERSLRENGSGPLPFDIIVASGPNAALPHLRPTERVIGAGEPVVLDVGVRISGYCSDVTRTICLGQA